MSRTRRGILLSALMLLTSLTITACSSSNSSRPSAPADGAASGSTSVKNEMAYDTSESWSGEVTADGDFTGESIASEMTSRKVIQTISFDLQTKQYEDTMETLKAEISAMGGYIQQSSSYGDPEYGSAHASLTIRIPEDRYEAFKQFVPTLGNVTYSSEGGEDVTTQYYDTDARLTVLEAQEKRILELLEQASTVEEMLQIENELTRIRTEIEQLTTVLKRYDDLVSFATVSLNISQASEYIVPDNGFWSRLSRTFQDSLSTALDVLQTAVLAIVWMAPYLIVVAIIACVIVLVLRRSRKRAAARRPLPAPQPPADHPAPPAGT